jgi:uncharacterized protein YjeT (DUF2065 family)
MTEKGRSTWRRSFNRYIGMATAIVGVTIVLSSFLFLRDFFWWYITVALGLVVALLGFVYGVNPFFTSERRHHALRKEVDDFIRLVRRLNTAVLAEESGEEVERVRAAMHDSVERMADLAGQGE